VLTYRHADAKAYLGVVRGHEKSYDGILLCESHANRFTATVGWVVEDHRSEIKDQRSKIKDQKSAVTLSGGCNAGSDPNVD
jgi:hypothetical protein